MLQWIYNALEAACILWAFISLVFVVPRLIWPQVKTIRFGNNGTDLDKP